MAKLSKVRYDTDQKDWRKDDFYRCKQCNVIAMVHRRDEGRIRCPKCGEETGTNILRYFNIKR